MRVYLHGIYGYILCYSITFSGSHAILKQAGEDEKVLELASISSIERL